MIRIIYDVNAKPVADCNAKKVVENIMLVHNFCTEERTNEYRICNHMMLLEFKIAIVNGLIDHSNIVYVEEDVEYSFNRYGRIENHELVLQNISCNSYSELELGRGKIIEKFVKEENIFDDDVEEYL